MHFAYCICEIKPRLYFLLGPILQIMKPISIFVGVALSLNVFLLYINDMQNAYNPKPNKDIVGRPMSLSGHFISRFYYTNDLITAKQI